MPPARRSTIAGGAAAALVAAAILPFASPSAPVLTAVPAADDLEAGVDSLRSLGEWLTFADDEVPAAGIVAASFVEPVETEPLTVVDAGPGAGWFVAPHAGAVSSGFGLRLHPILGYVRMHNGLDITTGCDAPIVSVADGVVIEAGWNGGFGNTIAIDHGEHDGKRYVSRYAHLSVIGVTVGQTVSQGDGIGLTGTTGLSTACHLHVEWKQDGVAIDPGPWVTGKPSPASPYTIEDLTPARPVATASEIKARIRVCESSGNYTATNPTSTASGAYQFLDGTWRSIPVSVRGTASRALLASPAQQDAAFDWLYARYGVTPWEASRACWDDDYAPGTDLAAASPQASPTPEVTADATATPSGSPSPQVTTDSAQASPAPTPQESSPASEATQAPTPEPGPAPTASPTTAPEPTAAPAATPEEAPEQAATSAAPEASPADGE